MKDKTYLNVLIMNCRSIRDYLKRILLIDILRSKRIDVALLQETFLIKKILYILKVIKFIEMIMKCKGQKGLLF